MAKYEAAANLHQPHVYYSKRHNKFLMSLTIVSEIKIIKIRTDTFSSVLLAFDAVLSSSGISVIDSERAQDEQYYHNKGGGENNDQDFLYIDKDDIVLIGSCGFLI